MAINILITDDEKMWLTTTRLMCADIIKSIFESKPASQKPEINILTAMTIDETKELLLNQQIHLLLLDKDLGGEKDGKRINGVDYISEFKSLQPLCQILVLTADKSVKDIARAMRNGASDYLFKSDDDEHREHRLEVIQRSLEYYADQLMKTKQSAPSKKGLYSNYVCKSVAMQRFDNKLHALSESKRPVLLLGPTGLGKGAGARRVSELSRISYNQSHREFVQLNIAATEKGLVDSILFGTEPGAYTGAARATKPGLLDAARDGDIFLDEIGDATLELQLKLLKVVEEKEFYRVGGNRPVKTNARFIFATNRDLLQLIAEGKFREDLYMRISVFEEIIPPLSERKEDIPFIIEGFLTAACAGTKNKNIELKDLPDDLLKHFMGDEIQGNIRGIENDIERLVAHIPFDINGNPQMHLWRRALGLTSGAAGRKPAALNVEQLLTAKTNFLDKNFPGLWALSKILEKRVFQEIEAKGLSIEQAAKLLKVSVNTAWSRKKLFEMQES